MVVMCGTMAGAMLPLLFQRLGLDPALMSTPFVAGLIDILGIVIYMKVSLMMLSELSVIVP
jgi:magnesium transporter